MKNSFPRADHSLTACPLTLLIFLFLVVLPGSAYGQWSNNGNNINNTNSENVGIGIGTSTPGAKLDIRAGLAARGVYSDVLLGGGPDGFPQFELFGTSSSAVLQLDSTGLFFYTNGPSWRSPLFLGNNGNVGIGTGSPSNLLHVNNSSGAGSFLISGSGLGVVNAQDLAAPSNSKLFQWRSEGGVFRMASINDAWSGFVQQNIFVASPGGNIGMGTANPTSLQGGLSGLTGRVLQIQNSGGSSQLALSSAGSGSVALLGFEVGDATVTRRLFQQLFDGANNVLKFRALNESSGAVTQDNILTLKNTGNVGIGTGGPGYRLDVQGGRINSSEGLCINGDCKTAWSQVGGSQWSTTGATINYAGGNVGINTPNPSKTLEVTGDLKVSGTIDGGTINAKYQDVAEWVDSTQALKAGTVAVLDPTKSNQVIASTQAYDSSVAGVISLQPGIALGISGEGRVLVATTGRVKVKVDASNGPINIGDLLVTSDREGFAMKSVPVEFGGIRMHRPGTLIGKALEPLVRGTGEILVLLSLQ